MRVRYRKHIDRCEGQDYNWSAVVEMEAYGTSPHDAREGLYMIVPRAMQYLDTHEYRGLHEEVDPDTLRPSIRNAALDMLEALKETRQFLAHLVEFLGGDTAEFSEELEAIDNADVAIAKATGE